MAVFVLLLIALILFALAAFNVSAKQNLVALGLFFVVAALMVLHGIPAWH